MRTGLFDTASTYCVCSEGHQQCVDLRPVVDPHLHVASTFLETATTTVVVGKKNHGKGKTDILGIDSSDHE